MSLLADLFSRSTDGVFAVDVEERIVFWNEACEQLLGTPTQAAIGHACFDVVHACDQSGQSFCKSGCRMARLAKGGSATQPFPLRFDNGRGKLQKLSMHTVLVPSQQPDLWSVVQPVVSRGKRRPVRAVAAVQPAAAMDAAGRVRREQDLASFAP